MSRSTRIYCLLFSPRLVRFYFRPHAVAVFPVSHRTSFFFVSRLLFRRAQRASSACFRSMRHVVTTSDGLFLSFPADGRFSETDDRRALTDGRLSYRKFESLLF